MRSWHPAFLREAWVTRDASPGADFLKHPGVPVGMGEVGEAGIAAALGVGPEMEPPQPLARVGVLVPDGADADAAIDEFLTRGDDVVDHQIQPLHRAGTPV